MERKANLQLAIIETIVSCLTHCVSHSIFKYANYSMFQVLTIRGTIAIVLIFLFMNIDDLYKKSKIWKMILSQFLVTIVSLAFFKSVMMIPVGETTLIFQTNTLWSQFIFRLFHREPISKSRVRNSLQCLLGIYLILDVGFDSADAQVHLIGGLLAVFTCLVQGFIYLVINQIGKSVSSTVIVVHFHIQMIMACGLGWIYTEKQEVELGVYLTALIMALFSLLGHTLQYKATLAVPYNKLSVYTYSQSIGAMFMDYWLFGKVASWSGQLGGAIVLASIFLQLREDRIERELQEAEEKQNEPDQPRKAGGR